VFSSELGSMHRRPVAGTENPLLGRSASDGVCISEYIEGI
jgi:hypothetical protein